MVVEESIVVWRRVWYTGVGGEYSGGEYSGVGAGFGGVGGKYGRVMVVVMVGV